MTYSMTAFARGTETNEAGTFTWELRCVNHRYLELGIHVPDQLRSIETAIREKIKQVLVRGKVDCYLKFQANKTYSSQLTINDALVKQLLNAHQQINALTAGTTTPNPLEILRWPDVIIAKETDENPLKNSVLELLDNTLTELLIIRKREGQTLCHFIIERLQQLEEQIKIIQQLLPNALADYRKKLLSRVQEVALAHDANRLEQELVIFAQRVDVSEELDRLNTHVKETRRTLNQEGSIGRALDFLMQELNRETNTLGAKCNDAAISQATVKMKVLIDQMREQIQNLE